MASRPRTSNPLPDWRSELGDVVAEAIKPLSADVKEMRADLQNLQLTSVSRNEVYDRAVMDEKLRGLTGEIKNLEDTIKSMKEFLWKLVGGATGLVLLVVTVAQHISIH